jgi:hypothetical protein
VPSTAAGSRQRQAAGFNSGFHKAFNNSLEHQLSTKRHDDLKSYSQKESKQKVIIIPPVGYLSK